MTFYTILNQIIKEPKYIFPSLVDDRKLLKHYGKKIENSTFFLKFMSTALEKYER